MMKLIKSKRKSMKEENELLTAKSAKQDARLKEQGDGLEEPNNGGEEKYTLKENAYSFLMLCKWPGEDLVCRKKSSSQSPLDTEKTTDTEDVEKDKNKKKVDDFHDEPEEQNGKKEVVERIRNCYSSVARGAFWVGFSVTLLKFFIFSLILRNSVDYAAEGLDVLGIPVEVDSQTRIAAVFATFITVYTQNDFFDGLEQLLQGYSDFESLTSRAKFYVTNIVQVALGFFGIVLTFILVMKSSEVLDLLLSFTAMEFVAQLDEIAFELAYRGFYGKALQNKTKKVKAITYTKKNGNQNCIGILSHLALLVGLFIWFAIIVDAQTNRKLQTDRNHITVQMSDLIIPDLATLSGNYYGCRVHDLPQKNVGPIVYISESVPSQDCKSDWRKSHGAFFFCDEGASWKFAYGKDGKGLQNVDDFCKSSSLHSQKQEVKRADAYDILTHADALWYAQHDDTSLSSASVHDTLMMGQSKELDEAFPDKKEEKDTCDVLKPLGLAMDQLFYRRLSGVFVKNRPIFYSLGKKQLDVKTADGEFVLYNGRRWIIVKQNTLLDSKCEGSLNDVACYEAYFQEFDPYSSEYRVHLISDPMVLQTEADTWIPTKKLRWYQAYEDVPGAVTTPIFEAMSVFEKTEYHDFVVGRVNDDHGNKDGNNATDVEEAKMLFLESSGLECHCQKEEKDKNKCKKIDDCGEGSSGFLWFEVATDQYPEDMSFQFFDYSRRDQLDNPQDDTKYDTTLRQHLDVTELQKNGYFELETGKKEWYQLQRPLEHHVEDEYRLISFSSCVPDDYCITVRVFTYSTSNKSPGIRSPGRIKLQWFPTNKNEDVNQIEMDGGLAYSWFICYFGNACDTPKAATSHDRGDKCFYTNEISVASSFKEFTKSTVPNANI